MATVGSSVTFLQPRKIPGKLNDSEIQDKGTFLEQRWSRAESTCFPSSRGPYIHQTPAPPSGHLPLHCATIRYGTGFYYSLLTKRVSLFPFFLFLNKETINKFYHLIPCMLSILRSKLLVVSFYLFSCVSFQWKNNV